MEKVYKYQQEKSGIYSIVNALTDQKYIGKSVTISVRLATHFTELRRGEHHNHLLQESFDFYGELSFFTKTLEVMPNGLDKLEEHNWLCEKERYFIDIYKENLFNLATAAGPLGSFWRINENGLITNR